MAVRQTMTIRASMTAYSTAVGPSSETRNRFKLVVNVFMRFSPQFDVFKLRQLDHNGRLLSFAIRRDDCPPYSLSSSRFRVAEGKVCREGFESNRQRQEQFIFLERCRKATVPVMRRTNENARRHRNPSRVGSFCALNPRVGSQMRWR